MKNLLQKVSANPENPNWENIIKRQNSLYKRDNEIRSEFERDYTRIINSKAYRRLKHKTQVFFSPENDHICTRIEHVTLVESISYTIAKYFGLNTELTKAIATAHDIGHSPFGHQGEKIISELSKDFIQKPFWHEKNGLEFVDKVELLETPEGKIQPLDLTYGVRDGIISHCGDINENGLRPRTEYIDLYEYEHPNQYAPYTWEGCVVKIADKLSYLGRDIEDAITLGILDKKLKELHEVLKLDKDVKINNTVILNMFIKDLCENSSLENGLCFSDEKFEEVVKCAVRSIEKYSENQSDEKYMMVQSGGSHMKVFLKDIVYAEVYNRKVIIHTRDTNIEYYGKLQELSEIAGADFFRTHRAYLVHFKYVQKYDANCVTMENGTALIAKQNYSEFVKQYLKYNQRKGKEIG